MKLSTINKIRNL